MTLKKYSVDTNTMEKSQKQHMRTSKTGKMFTAGKGAEKSPVDKQITLNEKIQEYVKGDAGDYVLQIIENTRSLKDTLAEIDDGDWSDYVQYISEDLNIDDYGKLQEIHNKFINALKKYAREQAPGALQMLRGE